MRNVYEIDYFELRSLVREMTALKIKIRQSTEGLFWDDINIQNYQNQMSGYAARLKKYTDVNNPEITSAMIAYEALRHVLSQKFDEVQIITGDKNA